MKKCSVLFLFISLTAQSWGQPWIKTQLNEQVSVNFPSIPEIQKIGNKKVYQIAGPDYVISVLTIDMNSVPSFDVHSGELDNFYKGVIEGRMDVAADCKLLHESEIKLGKYEGREIKYTKDFNGVDDMLVTSRIVLVGKGLFTFDFWDLSKKGQKKLIKKLFKSIHLN